MIPRSFVIDDFLEDFADWRAWADGCTYKPALPFDGAARYPGICADIPRWGITQRLSAVMRQPVALSELYLQLELEGVSSAPQAQSEALSGTFCAKIFLCRPEHCVGGIELVRHIGGMDRAPGSLEEAALLERDADDPTKWAAYSLFDMRPNRAVITDGLLFSRPAPLCGFGTDAANGRLILTAS